jgi:hypothetical protein
MGCDPHVLTPAGLCLGPTAPAADDRYAGKNTPLPLPSVRHRHRHRHDHHSQKASGRLVTGLWIAECNSQPCL